MSLMDGGQELAIAGFWRRIFAFLIDSVFTGLVGAFIGWVLYFSLVQMGAPARLIGFAVVLAYFGTLNSHLGGGQTLANRMLGIRVVDAQGRLLSVPRALWRHAILGVPFLFNYWQLPHLPEPMEWLVGLLAGLSFFGVGFAIVYLYIFNRRSRQSLHDLAVGSYVVSVEPEQDAIRPMPVWRGHLIVVAAFAVFLFGASLMANHFRKSDFFAGLDPIYRVLETEPHVINASVTRGWVSRMGGPTTYYLNARLRVDAPIIDDEDYALQIARMMAKSDPHVAQDNVVTVVLYYGFDIGIASWWRSQGYSFKPDDLQATAETKPAEGT